MTGAARRIDLDVRRQVARALLAESVELYQDGGNVRSERAGRRIFLLGDRVEFRLGILPARQEAVVPDVEWLERLLETALDELRNAWHQRRADDLLEHGLDARLRQLAVEIEAACDQAWRGR